jgi:NitT/TauT family transport system ATP-binding protein
MKPRLTVVSPKAVSGVRPPILEVRSLTKVFRSAHAPVKVLEEIDIAAAAGELICILGPSGCGKSTLLKILSGFIPASAGEMRLNDRPITRPGPDRCVVFQEDALFPWLTVAENIAFGLRGKGKDRRATRLEVDRFLSLVGLTPYRDYLPREISGGMKQRVALARVLILEPRVLLMDEPFASLDAQAREEMQNLLLSLWAKLSHTILFVTHDVVEAVTLADRILVMDKNPGRIRAEIPAALDRPRQRDDPEFIRFCRTLHDGLRGGFGEGNLPGWP